jgi:NADPH2:quinone reductase
MPVVQYGTYAQFISVPEDLVVHVPKTLSLKEAASIPLTALTAWQALFDFAKLKAHETVMVLGAAGGVGGMAVQMANWAKGSVYATARSENHPYVLGLGAQKVFDYTTDDVKELLFAKVPHGVDVVLDCVGGDTTNLSFSLVKKGGRVVSIVEQDTLKFAPPGVEAGFIFVTPNRDELHEIGLLLDHRKLKVPELKEFALEDAASVQDMLEGRHVKGKIVLKIL